MMRYAIIVCIQVLVATELWGCSIVNDTLIIGGETIYLEEQEVRAGDGDYWLNFSEDYRKIPRTIRWGVQLECGGMLMSNHWTPSNGLTPLSQLNPNNRHWKFSPTAGLLGYAMWNEALGLGVGYKQKKWLRDVEWVENKNNEDPYGYVYDASGFYRIDAVDVDSTGFYELDTAKVVTQSGVFQMAIHQVPIYFVFAFDQPRSLWSYQGMLGGVWSEYRINSGASSFLNAEMTKLSTTNWSAYKSQQWSMFCRATVSRVWKGNCQTFVALSAAWPFNQFNSNFGNTKVNPIDLTFGISWTY